MTQPTLPRAGTLTPGWYHSTAAVELAGSNLDGQLGDALCTRARRLVCRRACSREIEGAQHAMRCTRDVARTLVKTPARPINGLINVAADFRRVGRRRDRLSGITGSTDGVTNPCSSTDKAHNRMLSTVSGGRRPSRSLLYVLYLRRVHRCSSYAPLFSLSALLHSANYHPKDIRVAGYVIPHQDHPFISAVLERPRFMVVGTLVNGEALSSHDLRTDVRASR